MPSIEDLEEAFRAAQAATEAYSTEITEKYKAEFPPEVDEKGKTLPPTPALLLERARAWTDDENARLGQLRKAATQAALELHRARDAAKANGAAE